MPDTKPPVRILHLEDSPRDAVMIADLLEAEGVHCAISTAANRKQFEEALCGPDFDLILCDFNLAGFDGLSALRLAREKHPETPVIIVSGAIDSEEAVACLKAGATDYLLKQRLERLPSAVIRALEEAQEQRLRRRAEEELRALNADLERRVRERTAELQTALEEAQQAKTLLLRNDKLASLGRMCAGLIHEINNPLNYAAQGLFLLGLDSDDLPEEKRGKFMETLKDVKEGIARVSRIVSDLRGFTKAADNGSQSFQLKPMVETTLRFFSHEFKDGASIKVEVPDEIMVCGYPNHVAQVIVNILQNALDAEYAPGVLPEVSLSASCADQQVIIRIRDNGQGIPPENLGNIFDPFFTTKDVGSGMGLGLAICHSIMEDHGGSIEVHSEPGVFSEFMLIFPSAS